MAMPPYVIAHDATLKAVAEERPRSLAALRHEESPDGRIQPAQKGVFGRLRDAFNQR